jgi:hypothetical protein
MSTKLQAIRAAATCCIAIGSSWATADDAHHPSLAPGQDLSNPMFTLTSPKSEGWVGLSQSSSRIAFGRAGATSADSDVAAVTLFSIPQGLSADDFLALVKSGTERDAPSPQFEVKEASLKPSQARSYVCVDYRATSIDHGKQSFLGRRAALQLKLRALYCQYPTKPGLGFSISFSHRGEQPLPTFDAEAEEFIAGVEVRSPETRPNQRVWTPPSSKGSSGS